MVTENSIRLTPAASSKIGWIWNQQPVYLTAWEVVVTFQISGARLGADGFAIWFVEESKKEGPTYGYADQWNGLGVIFDTYDNDGNRNNPYVSIALNDGTKVWNHGVDGGQLATEGCVSHFRNTRTKAKIRYENGIVEVRIPGMSDAT
jgi:mannose-binding lectin 1